MRSRGNADGFNVVLTRKEIPKQSSAMQKAKFFSALLFAAVAALAQSACSDGEPQTRIEAAQAMAETLGSARDRATADLAAQRFSALSAKFDALAPTPEARGADAEYALGEIGAQAMRLKKEDYYGSDALKKALTVPAK